jgi:hypothetical protein
MLAPIPQNGASANQRQQINADKLESAFIIGLLEVIVGIANENRF